MYLVKLANDEQFRPADHTGSTEDGTFWISIAAEYPDGTYVEFPWGWDTRPNPWQQPAVTFQVTGSLQTSVAVPVGVTPLGNTMGDPYDMAFELDGDRDNIIKWEQPFVNFWRGFHYWDIRFAGWKLYHDEKSMIEKNEFEDPNIGRLVADDWKCNDAKPVTAVSWWGSYIGYKYDPANPDAMVPPISPSYFILQIWDDVPAGIDGPYSHPNDAIWTYRAEADAYTELMVGFDKEPYNVPGPSREPVFRYSVAIPDANQFQQSSDEAIYWLSILAVYPPSVKNYDWGWTNRRHLFNDDAVEGTQDVGGTWSWHNLQDQAGNGQDMSFVIFSSESEEEVQGDIDGDNDVDFYDYAIFAAAWLVEPADPLCDLAEPADGNIDILDLAVLCQNWLVGK